MQSLVGRKLRSHKSQSMAKIKRERENPSAGNGVIILNNRSWITLERTHCKTAHELLSAKAGYREQALLGWVLPHVHIPRLERREVVPERRDIRDVAYGNLP